MAINLNYNVRPSTRPDSDAFGPRPTRDPGGLQQSAQALQSASQSMASISDVLDKKDQSAQTLLAQKSYSNWTSAFNIAQENYKQAINKGSNEEIQAAQLEFEKFKTFNVNNPEYAGKSSGVVVNRESIMQPYVNAASESYKARENEFKHLKPYALAANTQRDLDSKTEQHLMGLTSKHGVGKPIPESEGDLAIYGDPTNPNNPGILNVERDTAVYEGLLTEEAKEGFLQNKLLDVLSIAKNQIEQSYTEVSAQKLANKYQNVLVNYPLFANLQDPGKELETYLSNAVQNITRRNNAEDTVKHNIAAEQFKSVDNLSDITLDSQNALTFPGNLMKLDMALKVFEGAVTNEEGEVIEGQFNFAENLTPGTTEYDKYEDVKKLLEFSTTNSEGEPTDVYSETVLGQWVVNHLNTPINERPPVNQYFTIGDAIQLNDLTLLNNYVTTVTDAFDTRMAAGDSAGALMLIDPEIGRLLYDGKYQEADVKYKQRYLEGFVDLEFEEDSYEPLLPKYQGAPNGLVNLNTEGYSLNDSASVISSTIQQVIIENPGELTYNLHETISRAKDNPGAYTENQMNLFYMLDYILPTVLNDPNFDADKPFTLDQTAFQINVKEVTDALETYNARPQDREDDPIIDKVNEYAQFLLGSETRLVPSGGFFMSDPSTHESYLGNRHEALLLEGGNSQEAEFISTLVKAKLYDIVKKDPRISEKNAAYELAKFEQTYLDVPTNTQFNVGGNNYSVSLPSEFDQFLLVDKNNVPLPKHKRDGLFGIVGTGELTRSLFNLAGSYGFDFNPDTNAEQAKQNAALNVSKGRVEQYAETYAMLVLTEGLLNGSFDYNSLRLMAEENDWDFDFESPKIYDSKKQKFTRLGANAFIKGMMKLSDKSGKPMSTISGYTYETRFGERVKIPVVAMSSGSGYVNLKTNANFPTVQHFANEANAYMALEQSTHISTWKFGFFSHSMKDRILDQFEDYNKFGDDYVGPLKRSVQLSAPLVVNPTDIITK